MRVVIATGIYPPDIGGPAFYAKHTAALLKEQGHDAVVVTYADAGASGYDGAVWVERVRRSLPTGVRHLVYWWQLMRHTRMQTDCIFALDNFSAAIPAALARVFRRVKLVCRLGGDFLWEKIIEENRTQLSYGRFYAEYDRTGKDRLIHGLSQWALRRADWIVYSTMLQSDIFCDQLGFRRDRSCVIANPIDTRVETSARNEHPWESQEILYAGRLVGFKNLSILIQAFEKIAVDFPNACLHIAGTGPQEAILREQIAKSPLSSRMQLSPGFKKEEALAVLSRARMFVLPSFTDISPNVILDCLRVGTPILVTKETGFYSQLKDRVYMIDAYSVDDIAEKIRLLMDDAALREYQQQLGAVHIQQDWDTFMSQLLSVITRL